MIFIVVDVKIDLVLAPIDGINMKRFLGIGNRHFAFLLSLFDMIVLVRVQCSMNHAWIISHVLHDIYLTALWPSAVLPVGRQHPYRRPCAATFRELCAD